LSKGPIFVAIPSSLRIWDSSSLSVLEGHAFIEIRAVLDGCRVENGCISSHNKCDVSNLHFACSSSIRIRNSMILSHVESVS